MKIRTIRNLIFALAAVAVFGAGLAAGIAAKTLPWRVSINGKIENLPIHIIKNMYFVSLADLAKIPGWKVTVDLGSRTIAVNSPHGGVAAASAGSEEAQAGAPAAPDLSGAQVVASVGADNADTAPAAGAPAGGPPSDARMTIQAALASLKDLRGLIDNGSPVDSLKEKQKETVGVVEQAQNLLWQLPRTNTLRTDLQVALEDLESQIGLLSTADQDQKGILPWTHPYAEQVMMKYPDLQPCRVTTPQDGVDVSCAQKMLKDLTAEDFDDIQRDTDHYK